MILSLLLSLVAAASAGDAKKIPVDIEDYFDRWATSFSPDSSLLALSRGMELAVTLVDTRTGAVRILESDPKLKDKHVPKKTLVFPRQTRFTPDGRHVAASFLVSTKPEETPCLIVWEVDSGRQTGALCARPKKKDLWLQMLVDYEGRLAALGRSGGKMGKNTVILVPELTEDLHPAWPSERIASYMFPSNGSSISPDGRRELRMSYSGPPKLRNLKDDADIATLDPGEGNPGHGGFSVDGSKVFFIGERPRIYDAATGRLIQELPYRLESGSLFADGKFVLASNFDGVAIWHVGLGKQVASVVETRQGATMLSPDGSRVYTAGFDGRVELWDISNIVQAAGGTAQLKDPDALYERARKRQSLRQFDEALDDYDKAIAMRSSPALLRDRGTMRLMAGLDAGAEEDFSAALAKAPSADLYHHRGLARQAQGNADAAAQDYAKALQLDPKLAAAHVFLGMLAYQSGRFAEALRHYGSALAIDPRSTAALFNQGIVHQAAGRTDAAEAAYSAALRLDPKHVHALTHRGILRHQAGRDGDLEDLLAACKLSSTDADAPNYVGLILLKRGDRKKALSYFQSAWSTSRSRHAPSAYHSGLLELEEGRYGSAYESFSAAVKLEPGNAEYRAAMEKAGRGADAYAAGRAAEHRAGMERARANSWTNVMMAIGNSMDSMATSISESSAGGGHSGSGSSPGGTSYSVGSGGSYDAAGRAAARASSTLRERQSTQQNAENRRQVERKLWNMNNPYR